LGTKAFLSWRKGQVEFVTNIMGIVAWYFLHQSQLFYVSFRSLFSRSFRINKKWLTKYFQERIL